MSDMGFNFAPSVTGGLTRRLHLPDASETTALQGEDGNGK